MLQLEDRQDAFTFTIAILIGFECVNILHNLTVVTDENMFIHCQNKFSSA